MDCFKRRLFVCYALLIVILLSGCAGLFDREGVEEEPPADIRTAMQVKAALIETSQLNAAAIHVKASGGSVRLSGFVETEAQRQLASTVARQVRGVKQVINDIEVK